MASLWRVFALADLDEAVAVYTAMRRDGRDEPEVVRRVFEAAQQLEGFQGGS